MLEIVLGVIPSLTSGVLVFLLTNQLRENRKIRDTRKEENLVKESAISDGIVCLLRVKLIEYHDHYMAVESIPSYALSNWDMMYTAYINLGGNGMIVGMDKEIKTLKII